MSNKCHTCRHNLGKVKLARPNFVSQNTKGGVKYDWVCSCHIHGYMQEWARPATKCGAYESRVTYPTGGTEPDTMHGKKEV